MNIRATINKLQKALIQRKEGEVLISLDDNKKIIWIITVNVWTGEVIDLEIKVVNKSLSVGNTGNGDETVSVSICPKKSEYEECGFDKTKAIEMIENSSRYKSQIQHSIFCNRLLFKDFT